MQFDHETLMERLRADTTPEGIAFREKVERRLEEAMAKRRWTERLHPRNEDGEFISGGSPLTADDLSPLEGFDDARSYQDFPKNKHGAYMVGDNVTAAAAALNAGEAVELNQPEQVSTLLNRLADVVNRMKEKGEEAPNFDLCKVSVKNTNLFCVESHGIPRIAMPQLKGVPLKGSKADKIARDKRGEVSVEDKFREHLQAMGAKITDKTQKASHLRATQRELNGAKTAGIARYVDEGGVLEGAPILVSKDNYIVDGHHRWSATVARDIGDNDLGDLTMETSQVDMGIIALLAASKRFAREWGIPQSSLDDKTKKSLHEQIRKVFASAA